MTVILPTQARFDQTEDMSLKSDLKDILPIVRIIYEFKFAATCHQTDLVYSHLKTISISISLAKVLWTDAFDTHILHQTDEILVHEPVWLLLTIIC